MTAAPTGRARRTALLVAGREAALAAVDRAMEDLRSGRGGVVVLEGPPGSGRTELLAIVDEEAAAAGIPRIRAREGRSFSLYRLARLRRRDGEGDRAHRGVVVCIDDVEHCDASTRRAAELAPVSFGDTAVLWVITGAPGSAEVAGHPAERRVRIEELSLAAADVLALRASGRGQIGTVLRAALDAVPRLPLHLTETARMGGDLGWPDGLLAGVGAEDRRVLAAGAALGLRFFPDDLAEVLDRPVGSLVTTLLAAIDTGVLVDDGDALVFRHRLVQSASTTAGHSDGLAARALRTLARTGASDELVAALREHGTPDLDPATLRELSTTAATRDLRIAADLAQREHALRSTLPDPDDGIAEQDAAARVVSYAVQSGDPDAARACAGLLGEDHPPALAFALAEVFFASQPVAARELAERALRLPMSVVERARLAAVRLACRAYADVCAPEEIVETAALAADSADARALALVGLARALDTSAGGDLVEALRHAAVASEVPDDRSHGPEWWIAGIFRAKLLSDLGRLDEAAHVLDSLARLAERRGQVGAIPNLLMVRATCETEAGRLTDAAAILRAARHLARAIGRVDLVETNAVSMLVRIAHLRGDTAGLAELRPVLEERLTADTARSTTAAIGLLFAVDVTSATEVAQWALLSERLDGPRRYSIARGLTDEVPRLRILLRHGLHQHAVRLRDLLVGLASSTDAPLPNAAALHADGAVRGEAAALRAAREAYRQIGRPMLAAQASEDLAAASGDPAERAAALREARALWSACDAHRETARIDKLLRSSGRRAVSATGPQLGLGLTVSEERVVREVIAGRTNSAVAAALFLSPNTVAVHLRRIYAKTGVRNRAELVALVRGRTAQPD